MGWKIPRCGRTRLDGALMEHFLFDVAILAGIAALFAWFMLCDNPSGDAEREQEEWRKRRAKQERR